LNHFFPGCFALWPQAATNNAKQHVCVFLNKKRVKKRPNINAYLSRFFRGWVAFVAASGQKGRKTTKMIQNKKKFWCNF